MGKSMTYVSLCNKYYFIWQMGRYLMQNASQIKHLEIVNFENFKYLVIHTTTMCFSMAP